MDHTMFTYEAREQTLVIHHYNCSNLKSDTYLLLEENYINRIVFDFTHTSFMDSSGIGVLLSRYKQMAASRGHVSYYGAGAQVRRILEMGGINRLIKGYEDRESALKG